MARMGIGTWCACVRRWRITRPRETGTGLRVGSDARRGAACCAPTPIHHGHLVSDHRRRRSPGHRKHGDRRSPARRREPHRHGVPAVEREEIAIVRRPTGGRAVWHEHEVTYAVAAPIAAFGRLRDAYRAIHERLAAALRSLGANVTLAGDRPTARRLDGPTSCFATSVGGEILAHGRKLVGSAQVRHGSAFLQHGSILLDGSQDIARAVSRQPSAVSGETTLRQTLGRSVTFEEVSAAIVRAWGDLAPLAAR